MTYGYSPSRRRKALRVMAQFIIRLFGISGRSIWSNELLQLVEPTTSVKFEGEEFHFRTGNGRLLWRAQTFLTEEPLMLHWIASMGESDIVLDIGANCGLYSAAIARRASRVYACELDPQNVGLIKENAFLNGVGERVVVLPFACGERDGIVDVYFRDLMAGDALQSIGRPSIFPTRVGKNAHSAPVLVQSLDEVWKRLDLPRPTKIKIDVDGNERTVFAGSRELCASAREIYFEDSDTTDCQEVLAELFRLGFEEVDCRRIADGSAPGSLVATGFNRLLRRSVASDPRA